MGEKPTIAFRVSDGQKSKWEGFAQENEEYNNLSHLIRVAVSHEMSDQYGPLEERSGGNSADVNKVLSAVSKIESQVEDFESQINDATQYLYASEGPNFGFTLRVWQQLPECVGPTDNCVKAGKSVAEITDDLGISNTGKVKLALKTLQHETDFVQSHDNGEKTVYWRTE